MAGDNSGQGDKKAEEKRSYFEAFNPWSASRSATPTQKESNPPPQNPTPANHTTTHLYGQSFGKYPVDCPPLKVLWYHAVDVPKKKPTFLKTKTDTTQKPQDKPPAQPKKYVAFSASDSLSLENEYQGLLEEWEQERGPGGQVAGKKRAFNMFTSPKGKQGDSKIPTPSSRCVPVNEDFLFEVNIEQRELSPIYWLGPTYDVRRGTWFYQEGTTLRPCEENLASQLEEGYLKMRPWTYPETSSKKPRARAGSGQGNITPKSSVESLKAASDVGAKPLRPTPHQPQTYRLFGTYMNNVATYQDSTTAYLSTDSIFSWVTSYLGGTKVVRGFSDPLKTDKKITTTPTTASPGLSVDEKQQKLLKRRSAPPTSAPIVPDEDEIQVKKEKEENTPEDRLTRQISNFVSRGNPKEEEEAVRKREEEEIENDYTAQAGETQNRDIEHLVLITHGIGQLLSLRMDSINFIHDINTFRKTLKGVYNGSADLRALNAEMGGGPGNCRVQVLPICWRHLLDFPKRREKKSERDLSDGFGDGEDEYPALEDITIEGMAFARSLISDLALDVLLYQSAYRGQISEIVLKEANRIYSLFKERNPGFKGKVHIMGHSLGSAIMFDILCRQKEKPKPTAPLRNPLRFWPSSPDITETVSRDPRDLSFDFDTEDFYCLGSPIGLFQMLKGRTIAARHAVDALPSESPLNLEIDDPFLAMSPGVSFTGDISDQTSTQLQTQRVSPVTGLPYSVSSPKVAQLFNIFHPSDPISYRLEPLISPVMRNLKPQAMPYTKKSLFSAGAQGLTGIGAKVGQSVNSLWSSVSSGITTSFLNRSLGLTSEDVARMNAGNPTPGPALASTASPLANDPKSPSPLTPGGIVIPTDPLTPGSASTTLSLMDPARIDRANARKKELASSAMKLDRRTSTSGNELTLLDDELETLYSTFQKSRSSLSIGMSGQGIKEEGKEAPGPAADKTASSAAQKTKDDATAIGKAGDEEKRDRKLRLEELKVRALNRNGRVDFCIQEGTLDYNPLNALASHMSYWADEDVSHFVLSQLLSNRSRKKL